MLADLILTILNQIAKVPNLIPRQIFRLYGTTFGVEWFFYIRVIQAICDASYSDLSSLLNTCLNTIFTTTNSLNRGNSFHKNKAPGTKVSYY